ncbi:MAG: diadenylate cyclase CdaA [Firmicutes bacterium]|nr:diadenylate cyclase CdaA [Bacillota bacterium]
MPALPDVSELSLPGLILAAIDIGLVAYLFYRLFLLIRGTRAVQLINGIFVLVLAHGASKVLHLHTLNWLLDKAILGATFAIPVVFQPELRRALEQLGRGRLIPAKGFAELGDDELSRVVDQVVRAAMILARQRTGALIVLERETQLGEIIERGIAMEALLSWELLVNTFVKNTPLHDGAVIIRGNRIMAAACLLPLAESANLGRELGTRHRAGVGVTEHSDAVAVIVSEETGAISVAQGGKLTRYLDEKSLREVLTALMVPRQPLPRTFRLWGVGGGRGGR